MDIKSFDRRDAACAAGTISCKSWGSLLNVFSEKDHLEKAFAQNLCWKTYMGRYAHARHGGGSAALAECSSLQGSSTEWLRHFEIENGTRIGLRCPEDISCFRKHDEYIVCQRCSLPVCHLCWSHCRRNNSQGIPRCLANDNFQDYAEAFIVQNEVRMIEAITAAPVFTCLVTYYVEGVRTLLLPCEVAEPQRSYAVRGNVYTLLMPWKTVIVGLMHLKLLATL